MSCSVILYLLHTPCCFSLMHFSSNISIFCAYGGSIIFLSFFFSFSQRPQPFEVFITNTTIIPPYSNPHFPLFISFLHNKEGTKAVNRGSWEMAHPYQSRWRMFLILQERGGLFELFRGYGDLGGFSSNVFLLLR